jgi:hypothetical protein
MQPQLTAVRPLQLPKYDCVLIYFKRKNTSKKGYAIARAVSSRLPTSVARDRSCGICGGQSGTGVAFLRVLRSPLANHSTYCSTLVIIHHPGLVQ